MDVNQKREKWQRWLNRIRDDLHTLAAYQEVFLTIQSAFIENVGLHVPSILNDYLPNTYAAYSITAIRRQIKEHKDSISLIGLLRDISNNPETLSREYFTSLYSDSPDFLKEVADSHFTGAANTKGPHVEPHQVLDDIRRVSETGAVLERFADKILAHMDKKPPDTLPKYSDISKCIEVLDEVFCKYYLLTTATGMDSIFPAIQGDWQAPFRIAWIPEEY